MSRAADLAALIVDVNTTEAKTDELTGKTTASSIAVTGEGGSTTTNLQQGLCKSWCYFNGTLTTPTLEDSLNKSSVADDGSGAFTLSFTNNMGNALYSIHVNSSNLSGIWSSSLMTASSCKIFTASLATGNNQDRDPTVTATVGDLA